MRRTAAEQQAVRAESVRDTVNVFHTRDRVHVPVYGGSASVRSKKHLLTIHSPDDLPSSKEILAAHLRETDIPFVPRPGAKAMIRDGPHVGHHRGNPLASAPIDPISLQILKVKDPVAYHVYCNQRPWVTQSTLIGEHLRQPQKPRVPRTAPSATRGSSTVRAEEEEYLAQGEPGSPAGSDLSSRGNLRETVMALRASAMNRSVVNRAELEAVSPFRVGYVPPASRQPGDMTTSKQIDFVNPATLPEPPSFKTPKPSDRIFYSHYPTDTSARDALNQLRAEDGGLVSECPDGVHPSVFKTLKAKERSLSVGPNPHAHKRRPVGTFFTTLNGITPLSITHKA